MTAHRHVWLKWICALVVFGLNDGRTYAAAPVTTTVHPTGSFPLDVQNVQAAVDRGGTVILKATNALGQPTAFDFGPPVRQAGNGVNLTTDVDIQGEQIGQHRTTIRGGHHPISVRVPVKSRIQGIDFEGPLTTPISLTASAGTEIIGNRIRGIVPVLLPFGFTETEGIFVSGFDDPQAFTGRIRIVDNDIEVSEGDFANGMQFDEVPADIEIRGNTVRFVESLGFIQTIGILVFRSLGEVDMVKNHVTMGPGDPDVFPVGIFVGGHAEARYNISDNTIITNHPSADGIDVVGFSFSGPTEAAVVVGNHIVMQSSIPTSGANVFFGAVRNSLMAANRIEGTAGDAIQILGLGPTLTADSNQAAGNDISQLLALEEEVFLGPNSTNNLFAGQCNTFTDLGVGNRITCGSPVGSAVAVSQSEIASRPGPAIDLLADEDIQRARRDAFRNP